MNRENVINLARNIFSDFRPVKNDLYRGELKIVSDRPAGIYFLDFNSSVPFDEHFNEYQDEVLSDEYYSNPGTLQWNLYLLLLQDNVGADVKNNIESNDKYGRKYIFNEKEFEDFFTLEQSEATITENIVLRLKEQLDKVGLNEVYSKQTYIKGVDNFVNGVVQKSPTSPNTNPPATAVKYNLINKIVLKSSFREYPKMREFNFGKVNLLKGINGVGKTSLFEAIELMICGGTTRNPSANVQDNCVEAFFDNVNKAESCEPSNNEKYRNRDAYWYGNRYQRGNDCYLSFTRFNFFNTDAAHNFSTSNIEAKVKEALSNLVFGEEFNYITERIGGFSQRIRPIYNDIKNNYEQAKRNNQISIQTIDRLKKTGQVVTLKQSIEKNIFELRLINPKFDLENEYSKLETVHNEIRSIINELKNVSYARSIDSLQKEKEKLALDKAKFRDFEISFRKLNERSNSLDILLKSLDATLELINTSLKYLSDETLISQVKMFPANEAANARMIDKYQLVNQLLQNIDLQPLKSNAKLYDIISLKEKNLADKQEKLKHVTQEIRNLQARYSTIDKFVSDIKQLGIHYINAAPNATSCPLCQAQYETAELSRRIKLIIAESSEIKDDTIGHAFTSQNTLNTEIEILTKELRDCNSIVRIISVILEAVDSQMSIQNAIDVIVEFKEKEQQYYNERANLSAFKQAMENTGLSEIDYNYLNDRLTEELGVSYSLKFENKAYFEKKKSESSKEIVNAKIKIEKLTGEKRNLSSQIRSAFNLSADSTYTFASLNTEYDEKESQIETIERCFASLRKLLRLNNDDLISDVDLHLSNLALNLSSLKAEYQNQIELKNAEKEKLDSETFIEKNKAKLERVRLGYEALNRLSDQNGSEQLESFFNKNLQEINDIFKTIHAPREFHSLVFKDNQLILVKGEHERKITEISTGQRAALAISIFISLNRKLKRGPNIIMFDDPISHIDDLNALSFLDFLRYFVLKERKQIFFATANSRLASLFEKKFDFLGDNDFKKWELQR
jgi:exonuclease SbcC